MRTPGNPGWEHCLVMSNGGSEGQVARLAELQNRYTERLSANMVDAAYRYSRDHLSGGALPELLDDVQVLLYGTVSWSRQDWRYWRVGAGLQFNWGGRAARIAAFHTDGEGITPVYPFDHYEALEIEVAAKGLNTACLYDRIVVSGDLTGVQGLSVEPKVIHVPQQII